MRNYQLGDVFVFTTLESAEWLLVEIGERTYKFVNLWNPEQVWISQRRAPVHRMGPLKHYRGGSEVKDES
jgi:hypothetical protein